MVRLCVGAFGVAFALCLLLACVCLFGGAFVRRCYCCVCVLFDDFVMVVMLFVGGIGVCLFVICVVVVFGVVVLVRVFFFVLLK